MCRCGTTTHLRGLAFLPLLILLGIGSREETIHKCSVTWKTQDYHRVSTKLFSKGLTPYNKYGVCSLDSSKEYNWFFIKAFIYK